MHGAKVKFVNAEQARLHNNFRNTKCKLLRTNAAIRFNKMFKIKQVNPKYVNVTNNLKKVHELVLNKVNVTTCTVQK
jgi:hypothetical protein